MVASPLFKLCNSQEHTNTMWTEPQGITSSWQLNDFLFSSVKCVISSEKRKVLSKLVLRKLFSAGEMLGGGVGKGIHYYICLSLRKITRFSWKRIFQELLSLPLIYIQFIEIECIGRKRRKIRNVCEICSWLKSYSSLQTLRVKFNYLVTWSVGINNARSSGFSNLLSSVRKFFFPLNYLNNCFNSLVQFACLDRKLDWIRLGRTMISKSTLKKKNTHKKNPLHFEL